MPGGRHTGAGAAAVGRSAAKPGVRGCAEVVGICGRRLAGADVASQGKANPLVFRSLAEAQAFVEGADRVVPE